MDNSGCCSMVSLYPACCIVTIEGFIFFKIEFKIRLKGCGQLFTLSAVSYSYEQVK